MPPTELVDRPRLRSLVSATEGGRSCVICAAPGYGGSTLLRQVAAGTRDRVAWVPTAGGAGVWQATAAALDLRHARTGSPPEQREVLAALGQAPPLWLLVDAGPGLTDEHERDLGVLAESLPPQVRMAVSANRDILGGPSLAGRVVVIGEQLLAFRPDEAVDLLSGFEVEDVETLLELTDGWAAGLLSAATAARSGEQDPLAWLRTRGVDRLFGTWLDRITPAHRDFLLATAALDALDVGSCNAVREADDSAALLAELTRSHAYVVEVIDADVGPVWQRQPLLTRFLRRIGEQGAPMLAQHSRAAEWFRRQGDVTRTMHHLLAAGRTDDAGHYLREHESSLFIAGQAATTLDWYDRLSGETHGTTALRLLRLGWGHVLSGDVDGAEGFLERLRALGPAPDDEPGGASGGGIVLEAETAALTAYLAAFHGDAHTMVTSAERAVAAFDGATDGNAGQLALVLLVKGLQWSGEYDRAALLLDRLERHPFPTDVIRVASLGSVRARRLLHEGRVHDAVRMADRAISWLRDRGLDPIHGRHAGVAGELAAALLERGDLEASATLLREVGDSLHEQRRFGDLVAILVTNARLDRVLGDSGAALRCLTQARDLLTIHAPGSRMGRLIDVAEARIRIENGDVVRAERLVRELPVGQERTLLSGRLALIRGADPRRALAALDPPTPRLAAEQHLLLASAKRGIGSRVAEAHLLRAGGIAADHGQSMLLVGSPPEVIALAEDVARRHGDDRLASLVASARRQPAAPATGHTALARGDLQLLALLPSRDSNAQIAQRLGVSENTIKTRLQRLYRKLDAHSRDEAISRARARGLLQSRQ